MRWIERSRQANERESLLDIIGTAGILQLPVPEIVGRVGEDGWDVDHVGDGLPGDSQRRWDGLRARVK